MGSMKQDQLLENACDVTPGCLLCVCSLKALHSAAPALQYLPTGLCAERLGQNAALQHGEGQGRAGEGRGRAGEGQKPLTRGSPGTRAQSPAGSPAPGTHCGPRPSRCTAACSCTSWHTSSQCLSSAQCTPAAEGKDLVKCSLPSSAA